jgi:FAD:protein FMN transferase
VTRVDHTFASMGTTARVRLESDAHDEAALERHAAAVRGVIDDVEAALSRFRPDSELSALNRDPREAVPASALVLHLALAVRSAGSRSGGLVDATLLGPLERAGYAASRTGVAPASLEAALAAAPPRRPARPHPARAHALVGIDAQGRVVRPPGVRLDSGGLGKGLAADLAALTVPADIRLAISCGGDLALRGTLPAPWEIAVDGAHSGKPVHRLRVRSGGVATSGVSSRLWRRADGTYAHHLLDPATGEPAWTGLVAATAVAPSALDAEMLAKTAVLSGPAVARRLLARRGGVLQHDDGRVEVVAGPPAVRLPRRSLEAVA